MMTPPVKFDILPKLFTLKIFTLQPITSQPSTKPASVTQHTDEDGFLVAQDHEPEERTAKGILQPGERTKMFFMIPLFLVQKMLKKKQPCQVPKINTLLHQVNKDLNTKFARDPELYQKLNKVLHQAAAHQKSLIGHRSTRSLTKGSRPKSWLLTSRPAQIPSATNHQSQRENQ
jgi:hypothetical protein